MVNIWKNLKYEVDFSHWEEMDLHNSLLYTIIWNNKNNLNYK